MSKLTPEEIRIKWLEILLTQKNNMEFQEVFEDICYPKGLYNNSIARCFVAVFWRFGVLDRRPRTLKEVAHLMGGRCPEQARQQILKGLYFLRVKIWDINASEKLMRTFLPCEKLWDQVWPP